MSSDQLDQISNCLREAFVPCEPEKVYRLLSRGKADQRPQEGEVFYAALRSRDQKAFMEVAPPLWLLSNAALYVVGVRWERIPKHFVRIPLEAFDYVQFVAPMRLEARGRYGVQEIVLWGSTDYRRLAKPFLEIVSRPAAAKPSAAASKKKYTVIERPPATKPATLNAPVASPGWYPDPLAISHSRWWDGSAWTEHTA